MGTIAYGGQAVMEGVMMQGPEGKAIACRKPNGEIVYKIDNKPSFLKRHPSLKKPVIRGVVSFVSSMVSGIQDLTWSAAQIGEEEDEQLSTKDIVFAVLLALVIAVVFFIVVPVLLGTVVRPYVGDFGRSLTEGLLRGGLFIGYVVLISRMKDIQRLFAYHGAEHKSISTYEAGEELTVENARKYSPIHCRCGTSFILMAMILMIVIFTFVGQTDALHRILIKLALMPVIAGVSYELFRLPLKFPKSLIVKALVAPGLAMQRLTTREPDDSQLEVALSALKAIPGFVPNTAPVKEEAQAEQAPILKTQFQNANA